MQFRKNHVTGGVYILTGAIPYNRAALRYLPGRASNGQEY